MATFVGNDPETGHDQAISKCVQRPESETGK